MLHHFSVFRISGARRKFTAMYKVIGLVIINELVNLVHPLTNKDTVAAMIDTRHHYSQLKTLL
jgi:hypothetical protein